VGSGEALNEHFVGGVWPEPHVRLRMMQEAVEIIRQLFTGEVIRHREDGYFKLGRVKLWTLPEEPVPVLVATSGPVTARWTGEHCDGIIMPGAAPAKLRMLLDRFAEGARRAGKDPEKMPKLLQLHLSWAPTREEAEANALREWPNGGMAFPKQDIRSPEDFEQMAKLVRIENYRDRMLISPDLEEHREHIQRFLDLGFTEVHVHNVGRNQEEFIAAFADEVLPALSG
jgi:G6PDH family F420-dependent oxidoreductase